MKHECIIDFRPFIRLPVLFIYRKDRYVAGDLLTWARHAFVPHPWHEKNVAMRECGAGGQTSLK